MGAEGGRREVRPVARGAHRLREALPPAADGAGAQQTAAPQELGVDPAARRPRERLLALEPRAVFRARDGRGTRQAASGKRAQEAAARVVDADARRRPRLLLETKCE